MSGTMSGTAGPETAVVITGEINAAVGHTLAINGSTVASNTSTATIASNSGNANYTSYLGTGSGLADQGFFNGDIGEVIIFTSALTAAQEAAVENYLQTKWLGTGTGTGAMPWASLASCSASLPTTTPVTITGGGTLDLNNSNQTIGSLASSDSTAQVLLGFGTLTTGKNGASTTFAGVISGGGNLVKIGGGVFTLTGSNIYTGTTTVTGGVLAVNGSLAGSGSVLLSGGALSGTGAVGGPITVNSGGTIAPGASGGTLTAESNVLLNSGAGLGYVLGTTNDSFLAVSGSLTLNPDVSLAISAGASNWATGKTFVLAVAAGDITDSSSSFTGWSISGTGLGSHLYTLSIVGSNSLDLTVNAGPTNHFVEHHPGRQLGDRGQLVRRYPDQLRRHGHLRRRHRQHRGHRHDGRQPYAQRPEPQDHRRRRLYDQRRLRQRHAHAQRRPRGGRTDRQRRQSYPRRAHRPGQQPGRRRHHRRQIDGLRADQRKGLGQNAQSQRKRPLDSVRQQHVYRRNNGQRRHPRFRRSAGVAHHGHRDGQPRRLRGPGGLGGGLVARDRRRQRGSDLVRSSVGHQEHDLRKQQCHDRDGRRCCRIVAR